MTAATRTMAQTAHIGDGVAVLALQSGTGPADALDALEARTGTRAWSIRRIRNGQATYVAA